MPRTVLSGPPRISIGLASQAPVQAGHRRGAEAQADAQRVHRGVAGPDYHHVLAGLQRGVVVRELARVHQVAAGEQLVGGEHAVQRLAGNAREARIARAGADEHRMKAHLVDHLLDGEQATDQRVALEAHAELLELADLGVDDRVRQAEIRNAVLEHAAGLVEGLVDGDLAAGLGHVGCAGHAGRSRTDDADAEAARLDVRDVGPAFPDGEVADPALQPADGHRLQGFADGAHALALVLLRADAAADRRQQVGGGDDVVGAAVVALDDALDEVRDRDVHRATADARLLGAHQAALGLELRVLDEVTAVDLLEVAGAHLRILLVRRRARLRDHADGLFLLLWSGGGPHVQAAPPASPGMVRIRQFSSNRLLACCSVSR